MVAQQYRDMQEVLDQHRIQYDPAKTHEQMIHCPNPDHKDADPSCSLNLTKQVFHCFGCGAQGGIGSLIKLVSGNGNIRTSLPMPRPSTKDSAPRTLQGCTIAALAKAKSLDVDYLKITLGWKDVTYPTPGRTAVHIPYYNEHGEAQISRYRTGLNQEPRFLWARGAKPRPYGLQFLPWIKKQRRVILVEGETNFASLHSHGFPVLGIPGKEGWKPEWAQFLDGLNVFVWPDADDTKHNLVKAVSHSVDIAGIITSPAGQKAANDVLQAVGAGDPFGETVGRLMLATMMLDTISEVGVISTSHTPTSENKNVATRPAKLKLRRHQKHWDGWLKRTSTERDRIVALGGMAPTNEKLSAMLEQIRTCSDWWKRWWCDGMEVWKYHLNVCHLWMCPICAMGKVETFLEDRGELLINELPQPTLFKIRVEPQPVPEGTSVGEIAAALESKIQQVFRRFTDSEGASSHAAANLIWGACFHAENGAVAVTIPVLINREVGFLELLRARFDRDLPGRATITQEAGFRDLRGTVDRFVDLVLEKYWDTFENLLSLQEGLARRKLLHGVGVFFSVTMAKSKNKPVDTDPRPGCTTCPGTCDRMPQQLSFVRREKVTIELRQSPLTSIWYNANVDDPLPLSQRDQAA